MSLTRGFSLIEVLVALVVLSIGLMGIASMQVVGLQFNQQALSTARAVELAGDMADRIQAGQDAARIVSAFLDTGVAPPSHYVTDFSDMPGSAPTACNDTTVGAITTLSGCAATTGDVYPARLANYDIYEWKTALRGTTGSGLADGAGAVSHQFDINTQVSTYIIDVRWSERGEETHYVLELRL
ncbi:MAG: type IV pilus modification protein PilV [Pseudomonadota bacterium]